MNDRFSVPAAIVVAGLLIAGAIYASNASPKHTEIKDPDVVAQIASILNNPGDVPFRAVSDADFIRGNNNAPITLIEYSDTECPFCKRFHNTLNLVMSDYPNKVRWVYRQYPIDSLHKKARNEALATECVAAQLGDEGFWNYLDKIFATTNSNDSLDPAKLPELAAQVGVNSTTFDACMKDGSLLKNIEEDITDGSSIGIQGTPFTLVIGPDGKLYGIPGAYSYSVVSGVIDELLHMPSSEKTSVLGNLFKKK